MTKAKKTTKMTKAEVAKIKKEAVDTLRSMRAKLGYGADAQHYSAGVTIDGVIVYCEKVLRLIKHIESLEKRLGSKEARTNP
jgi:hypothetical protein